jgi:hypothetical protein
MNDAGGPTENYGGSILRTPKDVRVTPRARAIILRPMTDIIPLTTVERSMTKWEAHCATGYGTDTPNKAAKKKAAPKSKSTRAPRAPKADKEETDAAVLVIRSHGFKGTITPFMLDRARDVLAAAKQTAAYGMAA